VLNNEHLTQMRSAKQICGYLGYTAMQNISKKAYPSISSKQLPTRKPPGIQCVKYLWLNNSSYTIWK